MNDLVIDGLDHEEFFAGASDTPRSSRATVRNPMLELAAARHLQALPEHVGLPLRANLMALRAAAHERAEWCWLRRRDRLAIFFRCVAVYSGHIARLINAGKKGKRRSQDLLRTANAIANQPARAFMRLPLLEMAPALHILALPEEARDPLRALLISLRAAAHVKAQHCWESRKAPLGGYWRSVAIHAGLVARLLR